MFVIISFVLLLFQDLSTRNNVRLLNSMQGIDGRNQSQMSSSLKEIESLFMKRQLLQILESSSFTDVYKLELIDKQKNKLIPNLKYNLNDVDF